MNIICIYLTVLRYCGQALGTCNNLKCDAMTLGPVTSSVTPFRLTVVTDDDEAKDVTMPTTPTSKGNKGFQLMYKQLHC